MSVMSGHTFGVRVDGALPRGFLRFLGLTALQAEGCGIAPWAMSIKSALRDWLFVSYGMKNNSADWLAVLASPYPASPDCPRKRGQNKTPRNILFINGSTVSTGYSATVHILHRMCKLVKVSPKPAHKRAFLLIDQPNCGGGKGTGFIGEPRDPRIQ